MISESELFAYLGGIKEFFALTDPLDPVAYGYLLVYAFLNVALLVYRRSLSIAAVIYLLTLFLVYAAAFFWEGAPAVFLWLYGLTSFWVILPERRRILTPFALMNIFNCLVVIPHAAGGLGALSIGMFFEEPINPRLLNTLWDLNGMAHTFLLLFCPVLVVLEVFLYWRRRRAAKKDVSWLHDGEF